MSWRIATDVGGTFTDLVVDDGEHLRAYKASTTPDDPTRGVLDAVAVAAESLGLTAQDLLGRCTTFVHGTTRALNAMLTGTTARTALLVTTGHPDILVFREGGRHRPFDLATEYPEPLVPRALTYEIDGRIVADGSELRPLDDAQVIGVIDRLRAAEVEAVAVCLLWSPVNGDHEKRVGALLAEHLPGVPFTLSHQLNPTLREYRRASSTAIDASLKPLMTDYIDHLEERLAAAGLAGDVVLVSSTGAAMVAADAAADPIHTLNSGPAMAPEAARHVARAELGLDPDDPFDAVVFDSGGTTCDISVVRDGHVVSTRETWIGPVGAGHITGFSSVDIRSIAAGGGSIATVDSGGLLHVGPASAGAVPGPACYGRGGTDATLTDACVVAGYLDPATFLDGALPLDADAAHVAVGAVAERLGIDPTAAAVAIIELATEQMISAIELITVGQGVDPRSATVVGGGGAAGLNIVMIARRLGAQRAVVPAYGAVLSAAGALLSPIAVELALTHPTSSNRFDFDGVNAVLAQLRADAEAFGARQGATGDDLRLDWSIEARYQQQVWDLVVPVPPLDTIDEAMLATVVDTFHRAHAQAFGIDDPDSAVELLTWRLRAAAGEAREPRSVDADAPGATGGRTVAFAAGELHDTPVHHAAGLAVDVPLAGPAIIEAPSTTIVLPPGSKAHRSTHGSIVIDPGTAAAAAAAATSPTGGD